MRNFSEIFVPKTIDDKLTLLPNPKLIRAMVNNVLPGVAQSVLDRNSTMNEVTEDDISQGVYIAAKIYKLFNVNIGQFKNFQKENNTAELHAIYSVVCPANSLFPNFLTSKLAEFYEQERDRMELKK